MAKLLSKLTGIKQDSRTFSPNEGVACSKTLVGIEVECENAVDFSRKARDLELWKNANERSLRNNGVEYVTQPVMGNDIIRALDELAVVVAASKPAPECTDRTGLHVHLDFRSETVQSLYRFIIVYLVFEKFLFSQCEDGREDNAYCIPLGMCEDLLRDLSRILSRSDTTAKRFIQNFPKYTAMNLLSLMNLGTVEIRMHEGTVDSSVILKWVNLLLSIKKYACETEATPQNLIDFVCASPEEYFTTVFGEFTDVPYSNDVFNGMLEGARAAQYSYRKKDIRMLDGESLVKTLYGIDFNTYHGTDTDSDLVRELDSIFDPVRPRRIGATTVTARRASVLTGGTADF